MRRRRGVNDSIKIVTESEAAEWRKARGIPEPDDGYETFRAACEAAKRGDFDALADCIERGFDLPPEPAFRTFLADIVRGKIKRPASRPVKTATAHRDLEIAAFVHWRRQSGDSAPIQRAVDFFWADRRAVQRAARQWQDKNALSRAIRGCQKLWEKRLSEG